eukprot:CAMPEP_0119306110 /NCGR_PEP_ID=MMETSP1333-20130426/6930_1 /TAXON_ID=418940 /ORGANISM="Scyphosphaera apsteinii, Strain RCC1455" /LENGTH=238 /DNA_ID=CAMNT_0007309337 /DNA_START=74 /DNA_END=790 /DNA_ORIENTATION=+
MLNLFGCFQEMFAALAIKGPDCSSAEPPAREDEEVLAALAIKGPECSFAEQPAREDNTYTIKQTTATDCANKEEVPCKEAPGNKTCIVDADVMPPKSDAAKSSDFEEERPAGSTLVEGSKEDMESMNSPQMEEKTKKMPWLHGKYYIKGHDILHYGWTKLQKQVSVYKMASRLLKTKGDVSTFALLLKQVQRPQEKMLKTLFPKIQWFQGKHHRKGHDIVQKQAQGVVGKTPLALTVM